jgi:conjugal transfer ATP-binding protein TraC
MLRRRTTHTLHPRVPRPAHARPQPSRTQENVARPPPGLNKLKTYPGVAKFLNHAFRRFRKYNGAAMLVVQDVGDFYKNPELVAVAANAAHKFILRQESESIDRAVASGHLALDAYGVSQLKTVHTAPGAYSEIMFLQGGAWTIARLVQPRFMEVLFSSKGAERDLIIEAVSNGMPVHDAINAYIQERG